MSENQFQESYFGEAKRLANLAGSPRHIVKRQIGEKKKIEIVDSILETDQLLLTAEPVSSGRPDTLIANASIVELMQAPREPLAICDQTF